MRDSIGPISLPPHYAFMEMWLATWTEAVMAASSEIFHFWCMPFAEPHHHATGYRFQMLLPEPIKEEGEHDLFA